MGSCDICNATVIFGAKRYSAEQMRHAVRVGFRPPQSTLDVMAAATKVIGGTLDDFVRQWINQVNSDTTDWSLCPKCSKELESTLKNAKPSGYCSICRQPMYDHDQIALLDETVITEFVNLGLILHPGPPSGTDISGKTRWVACLSCMDSIMKRVKS